MAKITKLIEILTATKNILISKNIYRNVHNYEANNEPIKFSDCYQIKTIANGTQQNSFEKINKYSNLYGLYAFVDIQTGEIKYIGKAVGQYINDRVEDHYDNKVGSLTHKVGTTELLKTKIYLFTTSTSSKQISYDESLLIGILQPEWNDE